MDDDCHADAARYASSGAELMHCGLPAATSAVWGHEPDDNCNALPFTEPCKRHADIAPFLFFQRLSVFWRHCYFHGKKYAREAK